MVSSKELEKFNSQRNAYAESLNLSRQQSHSSIVNYLTSINKLKDAIENNDYARIISLMSNDTYYQLRITDLVSINSLAKPPDRWELSDITAKIKTLKETFKDFEIVSIDYLGLRQVNWNARIIVKYADFNTSTAYEYDFGIFMFTVTFKIADMLDFAYSVTAKPVKDNKPCPISPNIYHPHIKSTGSVCIGSYANTIKNDIRERDLFNIMFNVTSVAQEYNPKSLQDGVDITAWLGNKCAVCQAFIENEKQQTRCTKTLMFMHKDCASWINDHAFSPFIVKTCNTCNKQSAYWIPRNGKVICQDCVTSQEEQKLLIPERGEIVDAPQPPAEPNYDDHEHDNDDEEVF